MKRKYSSEIHIVHPSYGSVHLCDEPQALHVPCDLDCVLCAPFREEMQTFREGSQTVLQEASERTEYGFLRAVDDVFEEAASLLKRKHHDYGPKNISLSPGGPLVGLRVRLHDKFARIDNLMAKGVEPENESLRDSWVDALNYCAIALLVLDGDWPES